MPRLEWGAAGKRFYESGVDRGVLYVEGLAGVPWSGLTSVSENVSGGDAEPYYLDGVKYLNVSGEEEFEATITAFTYPEEFSHCEGTHQPRIGLFFTQQEKKTFGLSYRTGIGNDLTSDVGYKIHIIYNALVSSSQKTNETINDQVSPMDFSWNVTTKPPALSGYRRTAHVVIDSRTTDPAILVLIENILYGTDENQARIPSLNELISVYDTISSLTVVDNGDGTWTATAPADVIRMLDDETFEITSPTAIFIDDDAYTLSSS